MHRTQATPGEAEATRARPAPDQEDAAGRQQDQAALPTGAIDPALLGDSRAWHSANAPLRRDLLLQLQRTHGNAYVQRVMQAGQARPAPGSVAVQRAPDDKKAKHAARWQGRLQVEASKQGHFVFNVHSFTVEGESAHVNALTVVMEFGAGSKELYTALTTNEVLKTVTLDMLHTNDDGEQEVAHTFTFHDVRVASLKVFTPDSLTAKHHDDLELEQVVFRSKAAP